MFGVGFGVWGLGFGDLRVGRSEGRGAWGMKAAGF